MSWMDLQRSKTFRIWPRVIITGLLISPFTKYTAITAKARRAQDARMLVCHRGGNTGMHNCAMSATIKLPSAIHSLTPKFVSFIQVSWDVSDFASEIAQHILRYAFSVTCL